MDAKPIELQLPKEESEITEDFAKNLAQELNIKEELRRHMVRRGSFRMQFENTEVEVDVKTGKGEMVQFIKTPVVSQAMKLHKNTSKWWIYFSDIFGISLIIIAITGARW